VLTPFDKLQDIAYNLRWDWHPGPRELFRELDAPLWEQVRHNPVALLRRLDRSRIDGVDAMSDRVDALWQNLRDYLAAEDTWYAASSPGEAREPADRPLVAYFSAEYGLTECLRIYSGGLGVLAGDHLKSASDLGVPLVGVGLLYREGYFDQLVDPAGRQREAYPAADFEDLPLRAINGAGGQLLRLPIPLPGRTVMLRLWRADVGRVPLFLLDADLPENAVDDRALTSRLYGGAQEMRISQEILLGIGGYRALRAMGIEPRSFHMNEGHAAFLGLELLRHRIEEERLGLDEAIEAVRRQVVFTTHTPVPAGHDRFPAELVARYFDVTAGGLGIDLDTFMRLGRVDPTAPDEPFTMTVLAIRLASQVNGVSELHGQVTREMWRELWPERTVDDVPIEHVTNGVHLPTWVHPEIADACRMDPGQLGLDGRVPDPDPAVLWRTRNERRHRLLAYVRDRVGARLDPDALTIAFARRFATYKRATLLLGDLERLERLLCDRERPVQVLFAGKAHPKDEGGKALIRRIVEISHDERFHDRIVFLPGYGIDVARELVQGADVWLNNPRRPMEASGTSGMKAAANGVLNVSILDGWWDEAYRSAAAKGVDIGWAIGDGTSPEAIAAADHQDEAALLRVLEDQVVPLFYDRDPDGVPRQWVERVAASIREVAPFFTTHRMVRQYVQRYQKAATGATSTA
jgi:glycogen phosphorylase